MATLTAVMTSLAGSFAAGLIFNYVSITLAALCFVLSFVVCLRASATLPADYRAGESMRVPLGVIDRARHILRCVSDRARLRSIVYPAFPTPILVIGALGGLLSLFVGPPTRSLLVAACVVAVGETFWFLSQIAFSVHWFARPAFDSSGLPEQYVTRSVYDDYVSWARNLDSSIIVQVLTVGLLAWPRPAIDTVRLALLPLACAAVSHWYSVKALSFAVPITYWNALRHQFAREGLLPVDVDAFLEWASRPDIGLMRATSTLTYRWRHQDLRDHLANAAISTRSK